MAESPVTSSIHGSAVDAYPSSLRDFRMTGVLNEDNATKTLCISGMCATYDPALPPYIHMDIGSRCSAFIGIQSSSAFGKQ